MKNTLSRFVLSLLFFFSTFALWSQVTMPSSCETRINRLKSFIQENKLADSPVRVLIGSDSSILEVSHYEISGDMLILKGKEPGELYLCEMKGFKLLNQRLSKIRLVVYL